MQLRLRKVLLMLAMALLAAPLGADWLVTRDGGRVETKGKWKVEGAKVVFTLPNGTMGILRKSEVDLDASAAASAEKLDTAAAAKSPANDKKAPVLVLTDKDIARAGDPDPAEAAAAPPATAPATPGKASSKPAVVVQSWRQSLAEGLGIEIAGILKNVGTDIAVNIKLEVEAKDEEGNTHKAAGFLGKTSLVRDRETTFKAFLPELSQLDGAPVFKVTAEGASMGVEPAEKTSPPAN